MQLTYRGAHYEYSPRSAEAVREATVFRALRPAFNLHYRGSVYTVDPNAEPNVSVVQPSAQLLYRGAAYALNGWAMTAPTTAKRSLLHATVSDHAESNVTHRHNLYTNVQRRLEVARAKGDQHLISLLERELQHIA